MKSIFRCIATLALSFAATHAYAEFHSYQIEQLYSNASGTVQFIVMHEAQGMGAEQFWSGHTLTSTRPGATQSFTFPANLPVGNACDPYYGCTSAAPSSTANTRVLIATQGFADLGLVAPDYTIPNGFLATAGGTINYRSEERRVGKEC